jgi:hypothetical protein
MITQLRHSIHCSVARYWALQLDPAWSTELLLNGLGFASCDVQPAKDLGTRIERSLTMMPKVNLPDAVERLLGRSLGISETGSLDKATNVWTWKQKLSSMADKISIYGTIRTDPDGPDRCVRVSEVNFEARLFGLGGIVEKAAASNIRDGFEASANWINAWLAKHPAT